MRHGLQHCADAEARRVARMQVSLALREQNRQLRRLGAKVQVHDTAAGL